MQKKGTAMTPKEFFEFAKKNGADMVDLKFVDLLGTWQHCTFPVDFLDEKAFKEGLGFDGSSIRGWKPIHQSDMMAVPDLATVVMDPFFAKPTLSVLADVVDPLTREEYNRDPRCIAKNAAAFIKKIGIADTAYYGPEPEFFIFDEVRYEQNQHTGMYTIDSAEGSWNTARFEEPNLGYKPSYKGGYFPVSPTDTQQDIRTEMVQEMRKVGIVVEKHHHEVATGGQAEIDMLYAPLVEQADKLMWYKYIVKNVAKRYGKTATFMPKPIFQDNGSGMHTHFSLWKEGQNLFAGKGYAGLSDLGLHAIAGLIHHAPAILAFAAPTTNSYRRLVPGFEAPVNLCMSARNRSAACRIPMYSPSDKAKRVEFRCPDPSCNGYLTFSAMLMAAVDGIRQKMDPGQPMDVDVYELSREELANTKQAPGSLSEAIAALKNDHEFLTQGDVFTDDLIETWIQWKQEKEIDEMALRPHPHEFHLYYDS
jgi:glutamine synthetase